MVMKGLEHVRVDFNPAKVILGSEVFEAEKALCSATSGMTHSLARKAGSLPVAEPQGIGTLSSSDVIAFTADTYRTLRRYKVSGQLCKIVMAAMFATARCPFVLGTIGTALATPEQVGGFGLACEDYLDEFKPPYLNRQAIAQN